MKTNKRGFALLLRRKNGRARFYPETIPPSLLHREGFTVIFHSVKCCDFLKSYTRSFLWLVFLLPVSYPSIPGSTQLPVISLIFFFFKFYFIWPRCTACGILFPQPGTEPVSPALGARSFNHWTTRKVLLLYLCKAKNTMLPPSWIKPLKSPRKA